MKNGRFQEAALMYRNAVRKNSSAPEPYDALASALVAQGADQPAITNLEIALKLRPGYEAALIRLGDIHLRILLATNGGNERSIQRLKEISANLLKLNSKSYDGTRLSGHLAMFDGNPAMAADLFSRANQIRPGQPPLQVALADAIARSGHADNAEALALDIISNHKSFGPAYDFLQLLYVREHRSGDVEAILRRKAENNPSASNYQLQLAGQYFMAKKPAAAEAVLQRMLADTKTFPDARLRVGDFYAQLGRPADAERLFLQGARADAARQAIYKKSLAHLYWRIQRRVEAIRISEELVKSSPKDLEALLMRTAFLLEEGKRENLDRVIADLKVLQRKAPRSANLSFFLGRAYLKKGHAEQAVAFFGEAIRKDSSFLLPYRAIAEIRSSEGRHAEALRQISAGLVASPKDDKLRLYRAFILRNLNRFKEARAELNSLIDSSPLDIDCLAELGLLHMAEGRFGEAEALYRRLSATHFNDIRPIAGLVHVYAAQRQYGKAIQVLNEFAKKNPASKWTAEGLLVVALRAGDIPLAITQLKRIIAANPNNAPAQVQLGQLELSLGNTEAGLAMLRKAVQTAPRDPNVVLALSAELHTLGERAESERLIRQVLAVYPDHAVALNNLAYVVLDRGGDLEEAVRLSKSALQRHPANRSFLDTLAMIYLKKNMVQDSMRILRSLTAEEPANSLFRMHLGMAFLQSGDRRLAKVEFEAALRARHSPSVGKQLRELLVGAGA
jgi:tetratricopeptide (TPR) repeat protein